MVDRAKFWWNSVSRGAVRLNSAVAWVGLVVLVLGVAAGIAVPLVFSLSHWVTAVVLMGIFIAVLLEGTYNVWHATDQKRANWPVAHPSAATHAHLDFELRGNGELFLVVRNLGPAEARAISVSGLLSNGSSRAISRDPSVIQPNAEQGRLISRAGIKSSLGTPNGILRSLGGRCWPS